MELLDRLYQRLCEVAGEQPALDPSGLTIADVYQHLIPYRAVRSELGIWELAQYEHALLRLLAGERGYLRVADAEVERELQRELASPNPILGIYRDYAEAGVQVRGLEPAPLPMLDPVAPPAAAAVPPAQPPAEPAAPPPDEIAAEEAAACIRCHEPLPEVPELRFCPACGADQQETPCEGCGTALRAEWNFCIRCGRRRAAESAGR